MYAETAELHQTHLAHFLPALKQVFIILSKSAFITGELFEIVISIEIYRLTGSIHTCILFL